MRRFYSPGPMTKPVTPLQVRDFQAYWALDEKSSPDSVREALEALVPRLADALLDVDRHEFFEAGASRIATFRRPTTGDVCFVLVDSKGNVIVGRVETLRPTSSRALEKFDKIHDEVLSVSVTDRLHPIGEILDLFVVARSLIGAPGGGGAEPRAYHGLISFNADGDPKISLSRDDEPTTGSVRVWSSHSASRLPQLLQFSRAQFSPNVDPFDPTPAFTPRLVAPASGEELVSLSRGFVVRAVGGAVRVKSQDETIGGFDADDEVTFMTTIENDGGTLFGVLGFDSRQLIALEAPRDPTGSKLKRIWNQNLSQFPSSAAFLPVEGNHWPDLLVAFRTGSMARLRFEGRSQLWDLWDRLWKLLGLEGVEDRMKLAQQLDRDRDSEGWRRALLFGAVEGVLQELDDRPREDWDRWQEALPSLFQPTEDYRILSLALQPLLATLRRVVRAPDDRRNCKNFLLKVLAGIYRQQDRANIEVLAQIDQVVRSVQPSALEATASRAELEILLQRTKRNRQQIWDQMTRVDKPTPEQRIQRCFYGTERWANSFLVADAVHLGRWKEKLSIWDAQGFTTGGSPREHWLAVTSKRGLSIHDWDTYGRVDLDPVCRREFESFRESRILTLQGSDGLMILAEGATIHLLRLDPESRQLVELDSISIEDCGLPGPFALTPDGIGGFWGVLACQQGRRSNWVTFRLKDQALRIVRVEPAKLPKVSSLDLARAREGGFLLLAGSSLGGPVELYRLTPGEGLEEVDRYWPTTGGALAVCFDRNHDPQYGILGDISGFVWCAQLNPVNRLCRLGWVHKLDAAVRSMSRVRHRGESCVLVGSDAGKLALLRCSDASRLWTQRLPAPIRRLSTSQQRNQDLLVTLRAGWLYIFECIGDPDKTWSLVERDLQALSQESRVAERSVFQGVPDEDITQAIQALLQEEDVREVLRRTLGREHRARILRFLASHVSPPWSQVENALPDLSCRELQLFLTYGAEQEDLCEEGLRLELEGRIPAKESGDDSFPTACAAWVVLLHRFEARGIPLEELIEKSPQNTAWYESTWLRLELARILLLALHREIDRLETNVEFSEENFLGFALPHLLRLPPRMVESCAEVLPNDGTMHKHFDCFWKVEGSLRKSEPVLPEHAETLKQALESFAETSGIAGILHTLFHLTVVWSEARRMPGKAEATWSKMREKVLSPVRSMGIRAFDSGCTDEDTPYGSMILERFKAWLPSAPLPRDTATQEKRMGWVKAARDRLKLEQEKRAERDSIYDESLQGHWAQAVQGTLLGLETILFGIVELEEPHLLKEVRPFLELASPPEVRDNNELRIELKVRPEGRRLLDDVSVHLDAGIPGGLSSPKREDLEWRQLYDRFKMGEKPRQVEFKGFFDTEATELQVQTVLESGEGGYRHHQIWRFPVPAGRATDGNPLADSKPFQRHLDWVHQHVGSLRDSFVLLVFDRVFGRAQFAQRWRQMTGGRSIDLDAALKTYGSGRVYAERPLDLSLVLEKLDIDNTDNQPILISSMDEVAQRWFEGECPGALEDWLAWIRDYAEKKMVPQVIWMASATHAARLRPIGIAPAAEVKANRPSHNEQGAEEFLAYSGHGLVQTAFWQDLVEEGARLVFSDTRSACKDAVWQTFRGLGSDLSLVARWLTWGSRHPEEAKRGLREFFEQSEVARRIEAELRALSSFDLLNALVGALATTTLQFSKVSPGLVAAEEIQSTPTKQAPKTLQEAGSPLTEKSLARIRADVGRPHRIKVEGLGIEGAVSTERQRTRLLHLAQRRSKEQRRESFRRLTDQGIGTWAYGIFRTAEPYRGRIRSLYERFVDRSPEERDSLVYEQILGKERSPLDSLPLVELADISPAELEPLLPGASKEELGLIRRIARQWRASAEDRTDLLPAFQALYRPRRVWTPKDDGERWDRSLLGLHCRLLGVGRFMEESHDGEEQANYPYGYHYWVEKENRVDRELLQRAIRKTMDRRQKKWEELRKKNTLVGPTEWTPRIVLTGPGSESLEPDPEHRYAVLRSADYLKAAWEGDLAESLLRRARVQMRLTSISPFQTSGPISPGSKYFFGREREMTYIRNRLRRSSFLVVGSRRVGKTSLLNQIRAWAWAQPDLEPVYIDLQRVRDEDAFLGAVLVGLSDWENSKEVQALAEKGLSFESLVSEIGQATDRLPIILLNEIDGLSAHAREVLEGCRALQESGKARFVMTGYTTIEGLGDPKSPFFNWTVGDRYNGRVLTLTELGPAAAKSLLGMLSGEELGLRWASQEDERRATDKLLDRSYRIPWVLQVFGQLLVERMEKERRGTLRFRDVEELLEAEGDIVWRYFDAIDFQRLGSSTTKAPLRPGYQLVLFCLVRDRYFLGSEPKILDSDLRFRSPLDLGFTVSEAKAIVKKTLADVLTAGEERDRVEGWFEDLDLERALPLLTLTLTLESDPERSDRFGFLMHILPRELYRKHGKKDRYLDRLIVDTAVEFWNLLN